MTQDEALVAIRQQVSNGSADGASGSVYLWMSLFALALSLLLLILRWRRTELARKPGLNDQAKLARELRKTVQLSRAELKQIKAAATRVEKKTKIKLQSPLVTVLCPSLVGKRGE
jgi:hypothetical protein